ncbi:peptidoglycan-binding protein [Bacillus thuringiensis]|nr:peptidoglycan-binding protein [Bacillus thuringiensis]
MSNIKRITDFSKYNSILPYASEMFGVYQSLIGWKSKRLLNRIKIGVDPLLPQLRPYLESKKFTFNADGFVSSKELQLAGFAGPHVISHDISVVLQKICDNLREYGKMPSDSTEWAHFVDRDILQRILEENVSEHFNIILRDNYYRIYSLTPYPNETEETFKQRQNLLKEQIQEEVRRGIANEEAFAGALTKLLYNNRINELNRIFFSKLDLNAEEGFLRILERNDINYDDPYLTFDPKKDVKDVTLSPLGIVHLFQQYFFELDTFLGPPTSHVWLSPGSTVELIETSSRKTITERTVELSSETARKTENSMTDQDEISTAVKEENKNDLKLGITSTVNQSWGTGSITATGSLNMDQTQQVARESTYKKMRQQTNKLSTEIRENYKSTFKTITESTDTSSKRYMLSNITGKLINYELRRKMRQVGIQVQDIGTYLCWETFVDEPGEGLGLANLIHIAQPANLLPVPDTSVIPYPSEQFITCKVSGTWNFGDQRKYGFVVLTVFDPPPAPEGLEVEKQQENIILPAYQVSGIGEDFTGSWGFGARFLPSGKLEMGVITGDDGLEWDERVNFVVSVALKYVASAAKRAEIDALNKAKRTTADVATAENIRITEEAFNKAVKERVEYARDLSKRKYEELRDEERIMVYRKLISTLMTDFQYKHTDNASRHVLSELIQSIFDIDKMLYFVAPEWWKPRKKKLGLFDLQSQLNSNLVTWSDGDPRPDNYLVTEKSVPAPMGSSLGWLLQLDGDNLRNAFLNAPWVKAIIPVRPGKEQAALHWLQSSNVEGSDGLKAAYAAPSDELNKIRTGLGMDLGATVTLKDAIDYLCVEVAEKYAESNQVKTYPNTEINLENKVTTTPTQKVYEHGFYPLQGGFRANPNDPNPDPNNKDKNFQVFDQWIEVLPTDQVVPVEVVYDPKTGRQL